MTYRLLWKTVSSSRLVSKRVTDMRYAVVIEKVGSNYGAYVPDLPGCIATGDTLPEVESLIREAIAFHLEGMKKDGITPPTPNAITRIVEAA
jgi:predicted RNase H-like HicB family nuclease